METIPQGLVDRPVTQLRICPLSLSPQPPSAITVAGATEQQINLCNCVGSACQLWQFEVGADPRTGDCSFNIAAQAASATAHFMKRMFDSAAQSAPVDQN